ncbi:uncharacterized protein LOC132944666 [Metopolophium dirhodum]|uniref:uncharacterized protein LOC132944666 n=1 Tax=Metopolophium dirhodum TaxID=44670 RepID=UPI0029906BC7|nr:uncharacterized protein LOC132944666 [Metopolophium dirhodum]
MSSIGDLYRHIIYTDDTSVNFLKQKGVLPKQEFCEKINNISNEVCGGVLKECYKNSRKRDSDGQFVKTKYLRCQTRGCQTYQTIRKKNPFFTYVDINGKCNSGLSLCQIVELVWYWAHGMQVIQIMKWTGRSQHTVSDWYNLCRDICVDQFQKRTKTGGVGFVVQIDESLFQGKRKYNRGRLRLGDRQPGEEIVESGSSSSDTDTEITNRNYGVRVQGPRVFGMCCRRDNIVERRLFIVQKRDRATLLPIIKREIEPGTTIFSDEWKAYSCLNDHGYIHNTVNHKINFIDPQTGAETQTMECYWRHIKVRYGIKSHGTTNLLERQLKEEWWRSINTTNTFETFFIDMKITFQL